MKLPFWATLLTILGVFVLCSLGTWQLQRLAWKNDILAKLNAAYNGNVTDLNFETINPDDFAYGNIEGKFLFNKALLLGHQIKNEKPGKQLIIPVKTRQGTILINMGFYPNAQTLSTDSTLKRHNAETIRFTGLARQPSWNIFTPDNDPQNDIWYKADTRQIAQSRDLENILPFILYADFASRKFDASFPNNTRWEPNNNHAQYAFFWFTMAVALIVIYALRFLRKKK